MARDTMKWAAICSRRRGRSHLFQRPEYHFSPFDRAGKTVLSLPPVTLPQTRQPSAVAFLLFNIPFCVLKPLPSRFCVERMK